MKLFFKKDKPVNLKVRHSDITFNIDIVLGKNTYNNVMKCVLNKNINTIFIGDICIDNVIKKNPWSYLKFVNKGYGTLMMNELLKFAKEHGYEKIIGNLSNVDDNTIYDNEHRERQIHFYKKFGFVILPNEESPKSIELDLTNK